MAYIKYNWPEIEAATGESFIDIYNRFKSTRKMGIYLGQFTQDKTSINYDSVNKMLVKRGVQMVKGGFNNKGHVKPKSGRVCVVCGKDPWPNYRICKTCNISECWTESYGFNL